MSTFSEEHFQYLKKQKIENRWIHFGRISIILLFLLSWEVLVRLSLLNSFLYSSPSHILKTIYSLFLTGELEKHIGITMYEVLLSFVLGNSIGFIISFFFWKYRIFSKIMDPYLTILNSLPKVALGPLIIIWMGAGIRSIILMTLLISIFTTIIHIYNGFMSVPNHYLILLKSMGATSLQIFLKLILPYNLEVIFATLKTNISLCFIGVIMGELLVSKSGLGYLIMYGSQVFQLDLVISSVFILGILSCLFYYFIDWTLLFIKRKRN